MKTFLYKLFGIGKIHEPVISQLKSEGIIALDEGIKATITYKNFRAPGRYSNWKRRWMTGAVALTEKRLILQQYSQPVINILQNEERFKKITVSQEVENILLFEFSPDLFLEFSSGEIEWRCYTSQAKIIADYLKISKNAD